MWNYNPWPEAAERFPEFERKHPDAAGYVLKKLKNLRDALNQPCGSVQKLKFSFLHPEGEGLYAIASSGKGKFVLRLYVYMDEATETIHQLTIGGKKTQQSDIDNCHATIRQLKANG